MLWTGSYTGSTTIAFLPTINEDSDGDVQMIGFRGPSTVREVGTAMPRENFEACRILTKRNTKITTTA